MNELVELLKKYIVLLIVLSLFGYPLIFITSLFWSASSFDIMKLIDNINDYGSYLFRVVMVLLLYFDFKRFGLSYYGWVSITTLFFPLLGVVIFALLYMQKRKEEQRI